MTKEVQEVPISTTTAEHTKEIKRLVDSAPKKAQIDKFREAARELDSDESEERFEASLKRIANAPPPPSEADKKNKPGQ